MNLSNAEKLILSMLADVHEKLGIEDSKAKLIQQAIYSGNTWALSWELPSIVPRGGDDATPEHVKEVTSYLDMWDRLESCFASLDTKEKADLKEKVRDSYGDKVLFRGFDANSESDHYSVACFLIEDMGRWTRFSGRELNSHSPKLDSYSRMLAVFNRIYDSIDERYMTVDELAEVLNARRA